MFYFFLNHFQAFKIKFKAEISQRLQILNSSNALDFSFLQYWCYGMCAVTSVPHRYGCVEVCSFWKKKKAHELSIHFAKESREWKMIG